MSPFLRVAARWLIPVALVVLAVGLVVANRAYVESAPAGTDFVARWEGGRAWVREQLSPYDPQVSQSAQERVYGRPANTNRGEDPQHFLYPFPALLVFAPLGLIDFKLAEALWMSLVEVALFASTLLWVSAVRWRWSAGMAAATLGFSVLWFPAFATLVSAQSAALEALLLAGALAAVRSQRDTAAGLLLASALLKPQVGLGLVVYVLVWAIVSRRWQLVGWLLTGIVTMLGASLLLDSGWPMAMARQVFDYLQLPVSQSPIARLMQAAGLGGMTATLIVSAALLMYLIWEWRDTRLADERRFLWTAGLTQAIVLLVAPFGVTPNLVTLLLPLVVVLEAWSVRQGRSIEPAAAIGLGIAAILSWMVSLRGWQNGEPSLWLLVGAPLVALAGLAWVRWWTARARDWSELGGRLP